MTILSEDLLLLLLDDQTGRTASATGLDTVIGLFPRERRPAEDSATRTR